MPRIDPSVSDNPLDGHRRRAVELVDMQSGGDVSRIVTSGVGHLPGGTVLEQMRYIQQHGDGFRRWLLNEPYGDPYMSIDLIVPADNPRAQAGYIIMEAMGYPLYSGSNTICTATAILENGIVPMQEGRQSLVLESPAGLARVTATNENGHVKTITTQGEPAYVAQRDLHADVPGIGRVRYDLVWSGAFFALVDSTDIGLNLVRAEIPSLKHFGLAFMAAVHPSFSQLHPALGDCGPLPFIHFCGPLEGDAASGFHSRSATYVHPDVICRSPTGTGTSARLAMMSAKGMIDEGQTLETVSLGGSRFLGQVMGKTKVGPYPALNSHITGEAWTLAHSEVILHLDDKLVETSDLAHLFSPEPEA